MADVKENKTLWEMVEKTNPKYTKRVSYGKRTFTAVDAYYQIKNATALWGPYGKKWGFRDITLSFQDISTKDGVKKLLVLQSTFFYPDGTFPVINSIYVNDDEALKKIYTDTLTKALSYLGFNSDIFLGLFDDARYINELKKEFASNNQTKSTQETQPQDQPAQKQEAKPQSQAQPKTDDSLEILKKSGVEIKQNGSRLIASGKTYQNSSLLKRLGFKWDSSQKVWVKEISKVA